MSDISNAKDHDTWREFFRSRDNAVMRDEMIAHLVTAHGGDVVPLINAVYRHAKMQSFPE